MATNIQPLTDEMKKLIESKVSVSNSEEYVTQEEVERNFSRLVQKHKQYILETLDLNNKGATK